MNLNKICIHGFKSFADKVVIDFDSGFTGIVGPNGCGKSNVIDAVRWVVGEQTASTLRCKRMSDLVYNGTDKRKPMSSCEVSLYLDNTKRFYSIDEDEVVLTRKYHLKKNKSEFFLNQRPAQLKEILDLFRDSGIGRDGYSIIGQGKVADIVSAKPEVRRQIFDDAAGISKLKSRKVETERRLERIRADLKLISAQLEEMRHSLGPLEKEANTAMKVKEFRRQLKFQDIHFFLYQIENGDIERKNLQSKLANILAEIDAAEKAHVEFCQRYNGAMTNLTENDAVSTRLRAEQTDLLVSIERKRGATNVLTERLKNLRDQRKKNDADTIRLSARLTECESLFAQQTILYNEKNIELLKQESEYSSLQEESEKLNELIETQENELERSRDALSSNSDKLSEIDKDLVKLQVQHKNALADIEKTKLDYKEKKDIYNKSVDSCELFHSKQHKLLEEKVKLEENKVAAEKNFYASKADLRSTSAKKHELEDKIKALEVGIKYRRDQISDYAGYSDVIKNLMTDAKENTNLKQAILGTVGEIIKVQSDLQVAIEIALGQSVQNIVTATPQNAAYLIDYIKEKRYGRATFLPISTVRSNPLPSEYNRALNERGVIGIASELIVNEKKFDGIISNLLGRTVIVDNKDTAISISQKYKQGFRIVTLEGESFATSGAITGGSMPTKTNRLLSMETDLQALIKSRTSLEKDLALIVGDSKDLEEESTKLEQGVKIIEARIHALDIEIEKINGILSASEANADTLKADVDKLFDSISMHSKQADELGHLLKLASSTRVSASSDKTTANDYLSELRDKLVKDKQRGDVLNNNVTQAVMALSSLKVEVNSRGNNLTLLKTEIENIKIELAAIKRNCIDSDLEIKQAESEIDISAYTDEDKAVVEKMAKRIREVDEQKIELKRIVEELDLARSEKFRQINEATEKRVREEGRIERIQNDLENMISRIKDDYSVDEVAAREYIESVKDDAELIFVPEKAQSESASLRRMIDRQGAINELAEQRYHAEKERYNEKDAQFKDASTAEIDLIEILDNVINEMSTRFTTSFEIINKNFNEVFQDMFGGGTASLKLQGSDNVLECGIDIVANPPGKQPRYMSVLSGGEQSLIAISILFAIVKLHPMPFSILDEVDAALDDSNVHIFAQFLRKYSKSLQFIVVTHRKPTMEQCDFMYGVTTEGSDGVSKVVSVTMKDATAKKWDTPPAPKEREIS
ncbi:MAG: chromosome segregation protein SMC [Christensenellaceae bacterium]|nr:chromosome segregation protein SMC [Christensenellaceae bacterium]